MSAALSFRCRSARALDVLVVLVERAGELVLKDEIMAAVWGRTVVESANLTVQISTLRRILDQDRLEGSCIQTVAARGYRFVAPVTRVDHRTTPEGTTLTAIGAERGLVRSLFLGSGTAIFCRRHYRRSDDRSVAASGHVRDRPQSA